MKQDFPVPESPINPIFICFIYFCAVTFSFFVFSIIYPICIQIIYYKFFSIIDTCLLFMGLSLYRVQKRNTKSI
jgi:hypothetical protein